MQDKFGVKSIRNNKEELTAAIYLQVSIVSQALIFVTRSRSWSFVERPGLLLVTAFILAQLVSSINFQFQLLDNIGEFNIQDQLTGLFVLLN